MLAMPGRRRRQQILQLRDARSERGEVHLRARHRAGPVIEHFHQGRIGPAQARTRQQRTHGGASDHQQPLAHGGVAGEQVDVALQAVGDAIQVLPLELLLALGGGQHGRADRGHAHAQQQDHEQPPDHRGQEMAQALHRDLFQVDRRGQHVAFVAHPG
ncbi:hypothetical protein G6F62_014250 [Rhizopus arrhizus]|nr:hypothetical protein G6F62_014250 [Rhizopus arrhizus]